MNSRAPLSTELSLVRAAAKAGVPYVLPNNWGIDLADEQLGVDVKLDRRPVLRLVEELGVSAWVSVTTGFWYEYSLGYGSETFGMDWKGRTWTFFDGGETRMNTSVSWHGNRE